jgi:hypothetical protein
LILHQAGSYEVAVRLDSENSIPETNEVDNVATVSIAVAGTVTPEWTLVHADEGRQLLGDETDVIIGSMDDALDHSHPGLSGNDSLGRPRLVAALQNIRRRAGDPAGEYLAQRRLDLCRGRHGGPQGRLATLAK